MRKLVKGFLVGAILGAALASFDGAVVALLLGDVIFWTAIFAAAGGIVGGLGGVLWACFAKRMVLEPPKER